MLDLLLKLIRALLASLYTLFEGMPALEAVRAWFGTQGGGGRLAAGLLLAGLALLLGSAAFLVFLWLLRRAPRAVARRSGNAPLRASAPESASRKGAEG